MTAGSPEERHLSADAFRALCTWAADGSRPLPERVRRRAALVLADDIGAMVAASTEPQVLAASEGMAASSSPLAEATVFGPGARRLDHYAAAAANGIAITWCELDERFRLEPCHAGAYLLPALLAEAEAADAGVAEVLSALVRAYELTARLALAFPFARMTVHPHAAFATIGAAAGAAIMRGLDGEKLADALSSTASMTFAGPFGIAPDGALVRNAWTAQRNLLDARSTPRPRRPATRPWQGWAARSPLLPHGVLEAAPRRNEPDFAWYPPDRTMP